MREFWLSLEQVFARTRIGQIRESDIIEERYFLNGEVVLLFFVVYQVDLSEGSFSDGPDETNMGKKIFKYLGVYFFYTRLHLF